MVMPNFKVFNFFKILNRRQIIHKVSLNTSLSFHKTYRDLHCAIYIFWLLGKMNTLNQEILFNE